MMGGTISKYVTVVKILVLLSLFLLNFSVIGDPAVFFTACCAKDSIKVIQDRIFVVFSPCFVACYLWQRESCLIPSWMMKCVYKMWFARFSLCLSEFEIVDFLLTQTNKSIPKFCLYWHLTKRDKLLWGCHNKTELSCTFNVINA